MTPTEELIKEIASLDVSQISSLSSYVIKGMFEQAVARLKELEREKEAYREAAIELDYAWTRLEFSGDYTVKKAEMAVDNEAQRIMKEKK